MLIVAVAVHLLLLCPQGANSPINVRAVALNVSLVGGLAVVGDLIVPRTLVSSSAAAAASTSAATADALALAPLGAAAGPSVVNLTLALSAILTIDEPPDIFSGFVKAFINQNFIALGLVSASSSALSVELDCALGALNVSVPLAARTIVKGVAGFRAITVDSFTVVGVIDGPPPAIFVTLDVTLDNPSPVSFALGEMSVLGIYAAGFRIGQSVAINQTIRGNGLTRMTLNGTLTPPAESLVAASAFFSDYLNGKNGSVTVVGERVTEGGGQLTPLWLQDAVHNISLVATIPGAVGVSLLTNLSLEALGLSFAPPVPSFNVAHNPVVEVFDTPAADTISSSRSSNTGSSGNGGAASSSDDAADAADRSSSSTTSSTSSSNSGATTSTLSTASSSSSANYLFADAVPMFGGVVFSLVHLPFSIPVSIDTADVSLDMVDPSTGVHAVRLVLRSQPVVYVQFDNATDPGDGNAPIVGSLSMTIPPMPLLVLDAPALSGLITQLLLGEFADILLTGHASPTVVTAVGNLSISNVSVSQVVRVAGLRGFSFPPPVVYDVELTDTTPTSAVIACSLQLTNPTVISGSLGPVQLNLGYAGAVLGTATVENLAVVPGVNILRASGTFSVPDPAIDPVGNARVVAFVSRYLSRVDSIIQLLGTSSSSPISLLAPAFAALNTTSMFPGIPSPLVVNGTLYADIDISNIPTSANASLTLNNSLAVDIALTNASVTLYMCATVNAGDFSCDTAPNYGSE